RAGADAGGGAARAAYRFGLGVRAEVGWLPNARAPNRQHRRTGQPWGEADEPLLSRGARGLSRSPCRPRRARRRARHRGARRARFRALQLRLHPAQSRVTLLSQATPALFVAFDLLAEGGEDLRELPLGTRRQRLEQLLDGVRPPILLTPYTRDAELGRRWFEEFEGAGLDGVIAKAWSQPYLPGKR